MSNNDLFDSDTDDQSTLFSGTADNPDQDVVEVLVGEGKKYKDVNALAQSVLYKDDHIAKIERENAALRQQVQQSLSLEEFLDKVKVPSHQAPSSPSNPDEGQQERNDISIEQIEALVEKRLQTKAQEHDQINNLKYVQSEAQKQLGQNYKRLFRDRAKELGESEEDLMKLAAVKPKVFLELMIPQKSEPVMPTMPRSEMDLGKTAMPQGQVRNMAWYKALKKSDPATYNSQKVQVQMHKDALALGEKFFQ
jgi:hypothetical protein